MMKISERVNVAIHSLAYMAAVQEKCPLSAAKLAGQLDVSVSHLAKIMQRMVKAGFIGSVRGVQGGFFLKKDPEDIVLLDIFESLEGPINNDHCFLGTPICKNGKCLLNEMIQETNAIISQYLKNTRLSDFQVEAE